MRTLILALAATAALTFGPQAQAEATSDTIPEVLIEDLQQMLDLEDFQAAAIAGNLAQETGNFTMLHQIGGSGLGYSQWTGSRKTLFRKFADDTHSYEDNRDFLIHELTGPYEDVLDNLRRTKTMEEATRIFMRDFLRPSKKHAALGKRVAFADAYLDGEFDGAGCIRSVPRGNGRIARC